MKDEIAGVIFDLDGVLEFQGKVYPGAIELLDSLRRRGVPIRILSNSTLKSRRACTENLNKALRFLFKGAKLVVMITENTDKSMGEMELTVGAYGKMLENAAGIKATYIGKPNRYIFDITLETMGNIDRSKVLMVGDRVGTDILGAKKAGLKTALVKTGEFREGELQSLAIVPDYVFDSVHEVVKLFL